MWGRRKHSKNSSPASHDTTPPAVADSPFPTTDESPASARRIQAIKPGVAEVQGMPVMPVAWVGAGGVVKLFGWDGAQNGNDVALPPGSVLIAVPPPHGEQLARAMGLGRVTPIVGQGRNGPIVHPS